MLSIYTLLGVMLLCLANGKKDVDKDMNAALEESGTHMYFILSNSTTRAHLVYNFLSALNVAPEHVTIISALDISLIPPSRFGEFVDAGLIGHWYWKGLIKEGGKKFAEHAEQSSVRGRWALQLSVVRAMETFVKSPYKNMLLLEDDVALSPDVTREKIIAVANEMIQLPHSKWDVQYLGWCWECAVMSMRTFQEGEPVYTKALFPLCRHSVLYSRTTINWYLKVWYPLHFLGGDEQLIRLACSYGIKKIRPKAPLFVQSNNKAYQDSHLGNTDIKSAFFDWTDCKRWRSLCKSNKQTASNFSHLSATPPDDLSTIDKLFR